MEVLYHSGYVGAMLCAMRSDRIHDGKDRHEATPIQSEEELVSELLETGIAEHLVEGGQEFDVLDVDAFRELVSKRYGNGGGRNADNTFRLLKTLGNVFPGGVISKEQFAHGERNSEPLFYSPSPKEAINTASIKSSRFILRFKDVLGRFRVRSQIPDENGRPSKVSYLEADTALVIFHPKYGNGYRDEEGVLRVMDGGGSYKPISGPFLNGMGVHKNTFVFPEGAIRHEYADGAKRSIRDGVTAELPHLVERGLIRPETDFKQITLGRDHVNERQAVRVGVSSSGSRMINGVVHYIGKQFYGKPVRIVEVSPSLGVVIDEAEGEARVSHIFNIYAREQVPPSKRGWHLANKELTQPREFNAEAFGIPKLPEETKLAFQERKEAVDRGIAYLLLDVARDFPQIRDLFTADKPKILGEIARVAYWLGKEEGQGAFEQFYGTYGNDGLRALLASAVDTDALAEVLRLGRWGEEHPGQEVRDVYAKFAELTEKIDSLEEYIRATFGNDDPELAQEVTQKILQRARKIISTAYRAAETSTLSGVISNIENIDAQTRLFVDVCRSLKERGEFDPKAIEGGEFITIHGGEFKGAFRRVAEEMLRIQDEQYGKEGTGYAENQPDLFTGLNLALKEHIENPDAGAHFHVFMHNGQLVGFFRLDEKKDGDRARMHLASVMGDPLFQGGKIIETLVENTLKNIEVPVYAECDPNSLITGKYLRMGFVATGVSVEKGLTVFHIERKPKTEKKDVPVHQIHEHALHGSTEGPGVKYLRCESAADVRPLLEAGAALTHWEQKKEGGKRVFSARLVQSKRV